MGNYRSAFNLRGCQNFGGQASSGTGSCGLNVSTDQINVNWVSENELTPQELINLKDYLTTDIVPNLGSPQNLNEVIRKEVAKEIQRHGLESDRLAVKVNLDYDCPKVGDAVRWNPQLNSGSGGYDLAMAAIDINNEADMEHLIEVVGVVESVSVDCNGTNQQEQLDQNGDTINFNATIVMAGRISFSDKLSNDLYPGQVYYLWDGSFPDAVEIYGIANNVTTLEPAISKPLILATGKKEAIVLSYRPLTGSPTGGRELREEYSITTKVIDGGWRVRVTNIGTLSSRYPLFVQLDYDRMVGPRDELQGQEVYTRYIPINELCTAQEAAAQQGTSSETCNYWEAEIVANSTEYGVASTNPDIRRNGINGVGKLRVAVKTTPVMNPNNTLLEGLKIMEEHPAVERVPNLLVDEYCRTVSNEEIINDKPDIENTYVTSPSTTAGEVLLTESEMNDITDGAIFNIKLGTQHVRLSNNLFNPTQQEIINQCTDCEGSSSSHCKELENGPYQILGVNKGYGLRLNPSTNTYEPVATYNDSTHECNAIIEMAENLYVQISSEELDNPIITSFKLTNDSPEVEIFPATETNEGITTSPVKLKVVNNDGSDLHPNHWANRVIPQSEISITCDDTSCCEPETAYNIVSTTSTEGSGTEVEIIEILEPSHVDIINNPTDPRFYTFDPSKSPYDFSQTDQTSQMIVSWKNMRENMQLCYPRNLPSGNEPRFMTIYDNNALTTKHAFPDLNRTSEDYDPRYTLVEIGATESLIGKTIRLTLNANEQDGRASCCVAFKFNGTLRGSHFTLEEIKQMDDTFYSSNLCNL